MSKLKSLITVVGILLCVSAFCGQPQSLVQVQAEVDGFFANASLQQRDVYIETYWRLVVDVHVKGNVVGQRDVSAIAPVIQKYDPAFEMHVQWAKNTIMRVREAELASVYANAMRVPVGGSMQGFGNNLMRSDNRLVPPVGGMSYGSAPMSRRRPCGGCFGSGRCRACRGTGIFPAKYGVKDFPCSCNNGKCVSCDGRGWF